MDGTEQVPAKMSSGEIMDKLRADGVRQFDELAGVIARGYDGSPGTAILCVSFAGLAKTVAPVLTLAGRSIDDLAAAVAAKQEGANRG